MTDTEKKILDKWKGFVEYALSDLKDAEERGEDVAPHQVAFVLTQSAFRDMLTLVKQGEL